MSKGFDTGIQHIFPKKGNINQNALFFLIVLFALCLMPQFVDLSETRRGPAMYYLSLLLLPWVISAIAVTMWNVRAEDEVMITVDSVGIHYKRATSNAVEWHDIDTIKFVTERSMLQKIQHCSIELSANAKSRSFLHKRGRISQLILHGAPSTNIIRIYPQFLKTNFKTLAGVITAFADFHPHIRLSGSQESNPTLSQ